MQPGTVLGGRYRLERKLGQGGMGSVYVASDLSFRRSVAVKVLHPEAAADTGQSSRFELEARAIASLGHPHIAALHDFHAAAPTPFLVMELIEGETLRGLLSRERTLAPARAAHIARQILSALGAAHRAGIIHRDIKPSNVMLLRSGTTDDFVKLVDFGIAKMAEGTTRRHLTADGSVIGTLQYMPPEQAQGLPVTPSADLYAVGVCLFEMLAGYNPFAVGEMAQMFLAVRDLQPPDVRQIRGDVPQALALATARALAKSPQARFESAEAMAAALEDPGPASFTMAGPPSFTVAGPPSFTTAGPPSFTEAAPARAVTTGRGVLWLIVLLLAALLVVSGAVVALLLRPEPPVTQAAVASAPPGTPPSPPVASLAAASAAAAASSAAPPANKPGTSRPAPNRSDAGAAPAKPTVGSRCVCRPDKNAPDSANLCSALKPTECACEGTGSRYRLCQVPYDSAQNCPDGSSDYRKMPNAHHGDACSGFANSRDPRAPGRLLCSVCRTASFPGNDGDACVGFHAQLGTQWKGTLAGCE